MEPHGALCRGCRGVITQVITQGHLQLLMDHEGGGQGVRVDTDDVNIAPLPRPPQALQDQQYGLTCVEKTTTDGTRLAPLPFFHYCSVTTVRQNTPPYMCTGMHKYRIRRLKILQSMSEMDGI